MLESEIIDNTRTPYFLHYLETLFRNEAYIAHLNKRIEQE
jgi:hypothetical protein